MKQKHDLELEAKVTETKLAEKDSYDKEIKKLEEMDKKEGRSKLDD